jgi:hypothetical protein
MSVQNFFFYKAKGGTDLPTEVEQLELAFFTFLLVHCVLYTTKIMFELQLSISKVTNILEVFNLGCMFVAIVTKYVEFILKK